MAKITLDNGMVIEGSVEEIKAMAEAFGVKEAEELKEPEPTYRKIDAYGVGDFVKFTDDGLLPSYIKADKYYEIIEIDDGDAVIIDEDDEEFDTCGYDVNYYEKVTEAPAESSEPEPLKVGDYAKVVNQPGHYQNDTIVKITQVSYPSNNYPYKTENLDGTSGDIHSREQLVKATEEEVAETKAKFERQQAEAKETERWAKIGREVNEYKVGDIVRVTGDVGGHEVGTIGELVSGKHFAIPREFGVKANGMIYDHTNYIELITPVEARFDRE